ncbi:imidazole glycerol phosphate synthase subunit HisH [Flavobacterium aurantiibacter]|uniref:Imidazole glycerol phosphate synthase subunit HisH n=1 Tax=Flavobacterium aurantiibacter TaxID=2023067 RepID=A0A255ZTN2_9FLAO|nr:imidazole glycerol phosphate synthase subunit HisH [Flavobacterium aurantiibacter]OYQ44848.1 imidazole glycerol phosphate synthase subunit HisH [Flavobacterium aurantiibacter]
MIAIIQYNAGNATSVKNTVESLGFDCEITSDQQKIRAAEKVIFPGVGAAQSAKLYLKTYGLDNCIQKLQQPVLGICLGQQLLCAHSEEGNTTGLGIFNAKVKRFPANGIVPHMGWNTITPVKETALLEGITAYDDVYFVHSYYCEPTSETVATCDYILPFSAVMQKDNFYATQFHPEKSAGIGLQILNNFLKL